MNEPQDALTMEQRHERLAKSAVRAARAALDEHHWIGDGAAYVAKIKAVGQIASALILQEKD